MINWQSVIVERQRRQDEIARAAEHHRSKHIMGRPKAGRRASGHIMAAMMIQAGSRLTALGCRLQARYTVLASTTRQQLQQDHIMAPQKAPCTAQPS